MCSQSAGSQLASGWRLKRWRNPTTSFRPCCHSLRIPLDPPPTKSALGSRIIDVENLDNENSLSSLGIALEKLGDIGGAIVAYDRATELLPSLTEAWYRAGALVYTLGHLDEAIGCFRRAAASGGKTSFGRLGKARALLTEDRNQEAELVLRRTLALDPNNAMAHDLLGNLLSEFGRFDEARECFQRTIAIAPLLAGCYYDL